MIKSWNFVSSAYSCWLSSKKTCDSKYLLSNHCNKQAKEEFIYCWHKLNAGIYIYICNKLQVNACLTQLSLKWQLITTSFWDVEETMILSSGFFPCIALRLFVRRCQILNLIQLHARLFSYSYQKQYSIIAF